MNNPVYTVTEKSITIMWGGVAHVVQEGMVNFDGLREAILARNWEDVPKLLDSKVDLGKWAKGLFTVEGETFYHDGEKIPEELNQRTMELIARGENPQSVLNFWEKLKKNPSWRSVQQLWQFLKHQNIPLDISWDQDL